MKTGSTDRLWIPIALASFGTALMSCVGLRFRVDQVLERCVNWTSAPIAALFSLLFLVGLGLVTAGWVLAMRKSWSPPAIWKGALLVHVVGLLVPPAQSLDTVCYAAIGHAMARFGASPHRALIEVLPAQDPFLLALPTVWQVDSSAYGTAFNQLARAIAWLAGDRLEWHVRGFQVVACAAMFLAAALVSAAVKRMNGAAAAASSVALILLCPVSIVEATMNGHNDALLALSVAAFVYLTVRGGGGVLALIAGVTVKASGVLLLGFELARLLCRPLARRIRPAMIVWFGVPGVVLLIAAVVLFAEPSPRFQQFARLLGRPTDEIIHCTRAVECLPRALFHFALHLPRVAWGLGLVFRGLGGMWLLYSAVSAARDGRVLAWAATAIGGYYLFFHGYMQSWYLLSLVPLLPFADARVRRTLLVFCVTAVGFYAVYYPFQCLVSVPMIAAREILGALVIIVPPVVVLIRRTEAAGSS